MNGVRKVHVSILLCYRDIHGIGYPTDPRLPPSRFGRFTRLTEIITEIVDLGDQLYCSGYCPGPRASYYTDGMSSRWLMGWSVGFVLSVLERSMCGASGVRVSDHGAPTTDSMILLDSRAGTGIAHAAFC